MLKGERFACYHLKIESSASPPEGSPGSSSPSSPVNASHGSQQTTPTANNAPKYGTLVPNRIFVGGISGNTTESELAQLFSAYGNVKATKVISDRAGVSKGYGFVTFETAEEATRLMTQEADGIVLKERKLNIAPAIKKQPFGRSYEVASPPAVHGNAILCQNGMPYTFHNGVAYFASAPTHAAASAPLAAGGDPTIYPVCVPATAAAAYVPQAAAAAAAAAAAHSPPATYPIFYPCTAQPIYMSQQFQYPALAAQSSHQFVYAGPASTASPGTGPAAGSVPAGSGGSGGGPPTTPCQPQPAAAHTAVPPATTVHLAAAPAAAHYYGPMPSAHSAPTAADPSAPELYYSVTPVHPAAHPYATATLFATTPDGFLFETQPVTESSSNHSPEDSSSSSSRSEVGQTRCVQRDSDCSGTHSQDGSCPPMPPAPASAPPVVSLLKLQQQHHHHHNHHQQQQQQQQQQQPQPVVPLQTCDDSSLGPHFRQLPTPSAHVMYGTPVFFNHPHHHQQQRTQPTPPVPYRQPRMRRPQYRREPQSLPSTPIRPNSVAAGAGPPGPRYGFPAGRRGPGASSSAHRRAQSPPTAHTPPPLPYSPLIRSRAPFPQPVPTPSNQFQGAPPRPATTYFQSTTSASGTDGPRRYGPRKSGPNNGGRYAGGGGGPKPAATVAAAAAAARLPAPANSSNTDDRAGGDGPSVVSLPSSCTAVRAASPCESETTVITAAAVAADSTHEVCRELQALTV